MADSPTTRYRVFLSYNSAERQSVTSIHRFLEDNGVSAFMDGPDMRVGDGNYTAIGTAMQNSECLFFVIGPNGLGPVHGQNEREEILRLMDQEGRRGLVVLLPGAKKSDAPTFLNNYNWVDLGDAFGDDGPTRLGEIRLMAGANHQSIADATAAHPLNGKALLIAMADSKSGYAPLPQAKLDVDLIEDRLSDLDRATWEIRKLVNPDREELIDCLKKHFTAADDPLDTRLLYYSGHGELLDRELYLVLRGASEQEMRDEGYSLSSLRDRWMLSPSKRLAIFDCCYAGTPLTGGSFEDVAILAASYGREAVSPRGKPSQFTKALADELRGTSGPATSGDLYEALERYTNVQRNHDFDGQVQLGHGSELEPEPMLRSSDPVTLARSLDDGAIRLQLADLDDLPALAVEEEERLLKLLEIIETAEGIPAHAIAKLVSWVGEAMGQVFRPLLADTGRLPVNLQLSQGGLAGNGEDWSRLAWEYVSLALLRAHETDPDTPGQGSGPPAVLVERIVDAPEAKSGGRSRPDQVLGISIDPDNIGWSEWFGRSLELVDPSWTYLTGDRLSQVLIECSDIPFDTLVVQGPLSRQGESFYFQGRRGHKTPPEAIRRQVQTRGPQLIVIELTSIATSNGVDAAIAVGSQVAQSELSCDVVAICHQPEFGQEMVGLDASFSAELLKKLRSDPDLVRAAWAARDVLTTLGIVEASIGVPVVFRAVAPSSDGQDRKPAARREREPAADTSAKDDQTRQQATWRPPLHQSSGESGTQPRGEGTKAPRTGADRMFPSTGTTLRRDQ